MLGKLLKGTQVAEILGISKALAYRLISEGQLPGIKFNRTVRVRQEDLELFIETHANNKQSTFPSNNRGSKEIQT